MRSLIFDERSRRPSPRQARQGFLEDSARALAMRAGLGDAENPTRIDDLAAATTGWAGPDAGAGFRTRALASFARLGLSDRDFLLAPVGGLLEGDFHVVTEVVAALGLSGVGPAAAEEVFEDAAAAEYLAEDLERVVEGAAAISAGPAVERGVAVLVIKGPLLRVAQDFVGLAEFLELSPRPPCRPGSCPDDTSVRACGRPS